MTPMTVADLLAEARLMLDDPRRSTVSAWPRAATLLARQAVETELAAYWAIRAPGVERLNMRAQLGCARAYLSPYLSGELAYTWHGLSRATHHHPYELDPTRDELASLLRAAQRLVIELERVARAAAA